MVLEETTLTLEVIDGDADGLLILPGAVTIIATLTDSDGFAVVGADVTITGAGGSHTDATGDDAVRAATGKPPEEWFALLDGAGAVEWPHSQVAAWLVEQHGIDPWWSQGVTVRYEQARGRRKP
jgi:hypothetical protein